MNKQAIEMLHKNMRPFDDIMHEVFEYLQIACYQVKCDSHCDTCHLGKINDIMGSYFFEHLDLEHLKREINNG